MKQIMMDVGIDAHKKDLFVAMLIGTQSNAVSWTPPQRAAGRSTSGQEARARGPGPRARVL